MSRISTCFVWAAVIAALAGCGTSGSDQEVLSDDQAQLIGEGGLDGSVPGFYFLPPTVLTRRPAFQGTFDPSVRAAARICDGAGPCDPGSAIAVFTREGGTGGSPAARVNVLPGLEAYVAVWDTRVREKGTPALKHGRPYRLHVYAIDAAGCEVELGFADLQVIAPGPPVCPDLGHYSPIVRGLPYVIAFRIEQAATAPPTVTMGALLKEDGSTPQNACGDAGGVPATLADGYVRWSSSAPHGSGVAFECSLTGPVALDGAACSALVGEGPSPNEYQLHFTGADGGRPLPDGVYALEVVGVDRCGHRTPAEGAGRTTWHVDGTAPGVTYVSPHDPGLSFPDIRAPGAPNDPNGTVGIFSTTVDASGIVPGPPFVCETVGPGGRTDACSPDTGYPLDSLLVSGWYQVQITGTDCVGNRTAAPVIVFGVDGEPPAMWLGDPSVLDGIVVLQANAHDDVTNIEDILCSFDGSLMITCRATAVVYLNWPLPTMAGVTDVAGELHLDFLRPYPGPHTVRYAAVDHWGHIGAVQELAFESP